MANIPRQQGGAGIITGPQADPNIMAGVQAVVQRQMAEKQMLANEIAQEKDQKFQAEQQELRLRAETTQRDADRAQRKAEFTQLREDINEANRLQRWSDLISKQLQSMEFEAVLGVMTGLVDSQLTDEDLKQKKTKDLVEKIHESGRTRDITITEGENISVSLNADVKNNPQASPEILLGNNAAKLKLSPAGEKAAGLMLENKPAEVQRMIETGELPPADFATLVKVWAPIASATVQDKIKGVSEQKTGLKKPGPAPIAKMEPRRWWDFRLSTIKREIQEDFGFVPKESIAPTEAWTKEAQKYQTKESQLGKGVQDWQMMGQNIMSFRRAMTSFERTTADPATKQFFDLVNESVGESKPLEVLEALIPEGSPIPSLSGLQSRSKESYQKRKENLNKLLERHARGEKLSDAEYIQGVTGASEIGEYESLLEGLVTPSIGGQK